MAMQREPLPSRFTFSLAILDLVPLVLLESSSAYHLFRKGFRGSWSLGSHQECWKPLKELFFVAGLVQGS